MSRGIGAPRATRVQVGAASGRDVRKVEELAIEGRPLFEEVVEAVGEGRRMTFDRRDVFEGGSRVPPDNRGKLPIVAGANKVEDHDEVAAFDESFGLVEIPLVEAEERRLGRTRVSPRVESRRISRSRSFRSRLPVFRSSLLEFSKSLNGGRLTRGARSHTHVGVLLHFNAKRPRHAPRRAAAPVAPVSMRTAKLSRSLMSKPRRLWGAGVVQGLRR